MGVFTYSNISTAIARGQGNGWSPPTNIPESDWNFAKFPSAEPSAVYIVRGKNKYEPFCGPDEQLLVEWRQDKNCGIESIGGQVCVACPDGAEKCSFYLHARTRQR